MGLPNSGPPNKTVIDLEADTDTYSRYEVINQSSFASYQPRHLYPYSPPDYSRGNPFLGSNGSEVKFVRDLNLNVTLSTASVVEVVKDEEHLATLPWLVKTKSACNSEVADGKCNPKSNDAVPSSNIKEEAGSSVQNLMWLESSKSGSCSS